MNPNVDSSIVCPWCSVRFHIDQNAGFIVDCPTCGARLVTELNAYGQRVLKMGPCKCCIRWYKNAPNYGLNATEWICDRSHPADDTCNLFIGVRE